MPNATTETTIPAVVRLSANAELPLPPGSRQSVFENFSESGSFGTGLATILGGGLTLRHGEQLPIIDGGEEVTLAIRACAHADLDAVIVGFIVKDRLGQPIFGDNSLERAAATIRLAKTETVTASFSFRMPLLAAGRYSITLALATGSILDHVQHHWIHDALVFDVSSQVGGVMFNLPPGETNMIFSIEPTGVDGLVQAEVVGGAE